MTRMTVLTFTVPVNKNSYIMLLIYAKIIF